jgi:hypothetical protein
MDLESAKAAFSVTGYILSSLDFRQELFSTHGAKRKGWDAQAYHSVRRSITSRSATKQGAKRAPALARLSLFRKVSFPEER